MGVTFVKLKLANIHDPRLVAEDEFLVDSGAHYTVVPERLVKKLGLKPKLAQEFELANGKMVRRGVSDCLVEYQKRRVPTQVVLGKGDDSALLGAFTLESMGLMLDPLSRKLQEMKLRL